jgi:hypothetical protein
MDQHRIHYLPVTERGSLCGIINMLDLVKHRLNEIELEANALKDYVAGRAQQTGEHGSLVSCGLGSKHVIYHQTKNRQLVLPRPPVMERV